MESEVEKKLKTLVEALTHSGSNALDEDIFKQVKQMCKSSQENIPQVYSLALAQLKKNNAQVRLSAFQLCKELFKRSVLFRENVLKDLNLIIELTAEINSKKLPPPKSAAEKLKVLAISTLKEWVKEFGDSNKKLKIAYNYLQKWKQVDFTTLQVHNSAEQVLENEQQRHLQVVNEEKVNKVLEEFNSNKSEIEMVITSLSNCLSLLLPPVEEFFIPENNLQKAKKDESITCNLNFTEESTNYAAEKESNNDKDDDDDNDDDNNDDESCILYNKNCLRDCGVPLDYNLTLQLDFGEKFKIFKTEENNSVIENAKDCVRLISNRFLPMVKTFIKIYGKCCNRAGSEFKEILDVKEKLESVLKKYDSLDIDPQSKLPNDDSSSDDEFEEVKKEGYEDSVCFPEELECLKQKPNDFDLIPEPSQSSSQVKIPPTINSTGLNKASCSNSEKLDRKKKLLSIAPKLPYDIDLYHWEDEHLSTPTLLSTKIDVDKFWGYNGSDDIHEIPNPDGVAALRTRVIEYSGTFEPVKWACRAPFPNGKLCPRKDRFKCPFHGQIVARDEMGVVLNKKDQKTNSSTGESSSAVPDYQNPEFLKDLQAATGFDLQIPNKKGKKRRSEQKNLTHKKMRTSTAALRIVQSKQLPGLIDVVRRQNNTHTRLSKKIFNRSSVRRVSSVLNKLDRNKFIDKYGDQFNYV